MPDAAESAGYATLESTEFSGAWPERPDLSGLPNVVYIVLDDVGFAQFGCYGSSIDTPNMDRLAANGLRYTNYHTTTLCSPSRACLLTGRNHHTVGMRSVSNWARAYPNGRGAITNRAATIPQLLRDRGFSTFAVGKWHLAPMSETSAAGPFDHWPLQKGFERYYGFLDALTDQFAPELTYDNHRIPTPDTPGYHVSEDMIDRAIGFVRDQRAIYEEKPFFLYVAFGACHDPHQAPPEYIEKYRGRFDQGYDVAREEWFERQKAMGIVPENTTLPPSNPNVPPWDSLTPDQQLVANRLQEAFAAMLDHTDVQIGRLVDYLEQTGQLDNTLIVLTSDNGASDAGGPFGTVNWLRGMNGLDIESYNLENVDEIGGPRSHTNYPSGWAQAGNTPLRWYKQFLHAGGIRAPLVFHWPDRISEGGLRHQFHHVTDVTPTVLDLLGMEAPAVFEGIPQLPVAGESMAYTFEDPDAPTRKVTQHFELNGHRSIWHEGWKAVTLHTVGDDFQTEPWELYHLDEDYSESYDLAQEEPERLQELIARWWAEAGLHGVLPLEQGGPASSFHNIPPGSPQDRNTFTYSQGMAHVPTVAAADVRNRSHRIRATIAREGSGDGVIVAHGGYAGGYALYVRENRLVYEQNCGDDHTRIVSAEDLPTRASVEFSFTKTGDNRGVGVLTVDGRETARGDLPRMLGGLFTIEGLDVGQDTATPVSDQYEAPFPFSGAIESVVIEVDDDQALDPAQLARAEEEQQ
ncbi:MAG: arylsulfatase [Chloroflexi bacterium]|nr:arylsulfatase [Chloroflexota bacterium]